METNPSNKEIQKEKEPEKHILKRPTYVLNILYNNHGIFLSKRLQKDKPMFNLWQVAKGKVERVELSLQVMLRETQEKTGLQLPASECIYLTNNPAFNCDVYLTKLSNQQQLQHTEPEKQGAWTITSFQQFEFMVKNKKVTPTLITFYALIMGNIQREEPAYINQTEKAEEALYGEAKVYGHQVNILIDSGAVGCIISKRYLDQVQKDIDAPTNIKIIDVMGNKSSPLGMVQQVPVQIRDIIVPMDMIVTNSAEYNVLLGNEWLKKINATIDYSCSIVTVKYEGLQ
jgi:ADP-ribose pyrophosphatase YjhB (NUDIX family)